MGDNLDHIPEYFSKPGVVAGLAETHPLLLVRQMANEIIRLKGEGSKDLGFLRSLVKLPEQNEEHIGNLEINLVCALGRMRQLERIFRHYYHDGAEECRQCGLRQVDNIHTIPKE